MSNTPEAWVKLPSKKNVKILAFIKRAIYFYNP